MPLHWRLNLVFMMFCMYLKSHLSSVIPQTSENHPKIQDIRTEIIQLINYGPVIASVDASQSIFQNYNTGILNSKACKTNGNNHFIAIVGYGHDNDLNVDYYIVRNSWGLSWGLANQTLVTGGSGAGYGYIARTGDGEGICGIQMEVSHTTLTL